MVGDRVGVAWLHWACGVCEQCREGLENLCRKGIVTGMMVDGGFAEYMRAKASHALKIPDSLDSAEAAPLFCAGVTVYRALRNAGVGPGQRVAVFGVGGLGHVAVQIAAAFGAEVYGFDVSADKLALARELGATSTFDVTDADTVKAVRKLGGMHVAVVTSAAKAAYDMAVRCLRPAGTLAVVGLPAEPLAFQALALVGSEIRIVSAAVGTRDDLRATLELAVAGKLRCRIEEVPLADVNERVRPDAARRDQRPDGPALLLRPHAPRGRSAAPTRYIRFLPCCRVRSLPSGAPMSKAFASQADLQEKKVTFTQALGPRLCLHRRGRPEHRHHRRRRRGAGGRHAGHAGDGRGRDPPHPRGHRQADQVRAC